MFILDPDHSRDKDLVQNHSQKVFLTAKLSTCQLTVSTNKLDIVGPVR